MAEWQEVMSSAEFAEWQAYCTIEPIGYQRGDLQAAIVAQAVYNRHRGSKEQVYKLQDFLPQFTPRRAIRTPQDLAAMFKAMTLQMGGEVVSGKRGES